MSTPWGLMHSYSRDRSVTGRKLAPGTVRRILAFASPYRRMLGWFLGLVVLDAVIGVVNPLLFGAIINDVVAQHATRVEVLAGVVAALALASAVVALASRWYSARIGEGLIFDMRTRVFDAISRQPIAFFTRTQTGALISRLNVDVLGEQCGFSGTLSKVLSKLMWLVLVLIAMFVLSWQITLISLLVLPIFVLPAKLLGGRLQSITRESYALNAEMSSTMSERFNVAGALLVKLYGRHDGEDGAFGARAARVRDIGVTQAMYGRVFSVALTLVAALGTALVYGLGGRFAAEGALKVGTIVALSAYLGRLYGPLTALSNVNVDILTALVSFERVFEVLDLQPAIRDMPGSRPLPAEAPATVEFTDVSFSYPAAGEVSLASLESVAVLDETVPEQVLHGVTFRADAGQLVALVGPSGAGKTTISQLISRMYDVRSGEVRVGGVDVRDVTVGSLRDRVGVVTQDAHLFHETIRANLSFAAPDATEDEVWAALEAAQIAPLVRRLDHGLDTVVGDRGYRLSGGEKQRIAIARLLLKSPAIVVLDEATAHLDSESELAVQKALSAALEGRTSLVIAHRLSTIRGADQILVIDGGTIVERGTHTSLLAAGGAYAELYRTQFASQERADGLAASLPVRAEPPA